MKHILMLLLLLGSVASYASSEVPPPYEELSEGEKAMAKEPDFCVRFADSYDPEVIALARPFIEKYLNPAIVDGHSHPLIMENFDVGSIILDAMTLAQDCGNKGVLEALSPIFALKISPRLKVETARLVTTLPFKDQEAFVKLWMDFYDKNAHPELHEKIIEQVSEADIKQVTEAEVFKEGVTSLERLKVFNAQKTPVWGAHKIETPSCAYFWPDDIPLTSLIETGCPLEKFSTALSKVLFLFPEDQRLEKIGSLLNQYSEDFQPDSLLNYVMKEGNIDKELHRLITFLSSYGQGESELKGELPSVVWWYAGVSPIITLEDVQEVEKEVREILKANDNVITFHEFHDLLSTPYKKWDAERKKST